MFRGNIRDVVSRDHNRDVKFKGDIRNIFRGDITDVMFRVDIRSAMIQWS